jgi:predicted PurR-regulated permease PerM
MKKQKKHHKEDLPKQISNVLVSYFKTQFLLILLVTLLSWVILSALNVRFALLLALITGLSSLVPFWGTTITAGIASLVAIFDNTRFLPNLHVIIEGLVVLSIYILLNLFVDYFLFPYMNAKALQIHPLLLLLIIILATGAFGIIGAFLAVPVILVVKTIVANSSHT